MDVHMSFDMNEVNLTHGADGSIYNERTHVVSYTRPPGFGLSTGICPSGSINIQQYSKLTLVYVAIGRPNGAGFVCGRVCMWGACLVA